MSAAAAVAPKSTSVRKTLRPRRAYLKVVVDCEEKGLVIDDEKAAALFKAAVQSVFGETGSVHFEHHVADWTTTSRSGILWCDYRALTGFRAALMLFTAFEGKTVRIRVERAATLLSQLAGDSRLWAAGINATAPS